MIDMKYRGHNGYIKSLETDPKSQTVAQLYLNIT
jgi:hypothetical protein